MANINTNLINNNGDNLYPVTFSNNILMSDDNTKTLDEALSGKLDSSDSIDASTVNGHTVLSNVPADAQFTDTHYTATEVVGDSANAMANVNATNGHVYLNLIENSSVRSSHKIFGSNGTTVTSNSSGTIRIDSHTHDFSQITIKTSNWSNGIYTTSYEYLSYAIYLDPASTITKAQLQALGNAMLVGMNNNGYCAFKCLGTVPTVDVPVKLEVVPLT